MKQQLYKYSIIYHPEKGNSKIIKVGHELAINEKQLQLKLARSIPKKFDKVLDRVEVTTQLYFQSYSYSYGYVPLSGTYTNTSQLSNVTSLANSSVDGVVYTSKVNDILKTKGDISNG